MGLVGLAAAPTDDPLELLTFLMRQPSHTHWFGHAPMKTASAAEVVDAPTNEGSWSGH
jgi:hypothetical protein